MAADNKESVLLKGFPKTGVTVKAEQKIITQGYYVGVQTSFILLVNKRLEPGVYTLRLED